MNNIESLPYYLPEIVLITTFLAVMIVDLLLRDNEKALSGLLALVGVGSALAVQWVASQRFHGSHTLFHGLMAYDSFATYVKLFALIAAACAILISLKSREVSGRHHGEYYLLLLGVTLGIFMLAGARHMLTLYLGMETLSILSFLMTGFQRSNRRASEGALKYVIYGGAASGVMIYGFSLLYGLTGAMDFTGIRTALAAGQGGGSVLYISFLFIFIGFAYKIAAFPAHMWAPDAYTAAPAPFTGFLSVGPKMAGFAVMIRFFYTALAGRLPNGEFGPIGIEWVDFLVVASIATMTIGNFTALQQSNVKRMLAYSSIAHAGYVMMGLTTLNEAGLMAAMFYLFLYLLMNFGAFLVVSMVADATGSEELDAYRGLNRRQPLIAFSMTIFLLSLSGLPPAAGIVGKFFLFKAVLDHGFIWFALIGVFNSFLGVYYYARIFKAMYLTDPDPNAAEDGPVSNFNRALLLLFCIPNVAFLVAFSPIIELASGAVRILIR